MSRLSLEDLPSAPESRASRRLDERDERSRRRRRRLRAVVVLLVCLLVVGSGAWAAEGQLHSLYDRYTAPKDYTGSGTGRVEVEVSAGASGRTIGQVLADKGVVKTSGAFADAATKDTRAASIQPGTYALRRHMSAASALGLLLEPASRLSYKVVIPEGFTAAKTLQRLAQETGRPLEEFTAAAKDPAVGLPVEANGAVEGYLYPATYQFDPGTTPTQMLATMVAKAEKVMGAVGFPADAAQRHDALVEASLVQAEAGSDEDMGKVARVLDNRMTAGEALQLDTTVNYANDKSGLTTTAADRANPSPYNTYVHTGLPPGPINAPGQAAMAAVLAPTPGNWKFFVVVDPSTGQTLFADTLAEHQENVAKFQAWMKAHPQGVRSAVLGHPIAHSLSPALHLAAYEALGLHGWRYEALDVDTDALPGFVAALDATWAGLSLTMPLKQAVIPLLGGVSDLAGAVGAVNTVVPAPLRPGARDLAWRGENTDVAGILAALWEAGVERAGTGAVLGGGATAASALAALAELGVREPRAHVRSPDRAGALAEVARRLGVTLHLVPWRPDGADPRAAAPRDAGGSDDAALAASLGEVDVVVSTVPAGAADPLAVHVARGRRARAALLDVVYAPRPTALVRAWTARGGTAVDGTLMLLHQAAAQVGLMTGRPAPMDAMRSALDGALAR